MNQEQLEKVRTGQGFIAALDQSGGSTPKALKLYGIEESAYDGDDEMFDLIHQMRSRIITSPSFGGDRVLGAILFEQTMDRQIDGIDTAEYLWMRKQVVPFLKVDKGLEADADGAQVMKPIDGLAALLERAKAKGVFGTKERSVINLAILRLFRAHDIDIPYPQRVVHWQPPSDTSGGGAPPPLPLGDSVGVTSPASPL